jgi:PAS domain S-box-containing protein
MTIGLGNIRMPYYLWFLFLFLIGLAAWCGHGLRRKNQHLNRLKKALRETTLKCRHLEGNYGQKELLRKNTEEKLRSYLHLLDALLNTMSNPVYFKDRQGVFQGCNQVFAKTLLGLTRDRIIGKRPQDLPEQIPPDLAASYQRQEMVMFEKNGFHTFEAEVLCADGVRREFLFNLAPSQNQSGKLLGSVSVLSDLTEKNRAAQVRLLKERLEGVLETAGGVCHEFNQPLQALSGYLEILAAKLQDPPAETLALVEKALEQIERMGSITAKLQGITRYETMVYTGNKKIIDIHKSSRQAVWVGADETDT